MPPKEKKEKNKHDAATVEAQKEAMPSFCPVAATMNLLDGKWTLQVVHALLLGHKRFNEIAQALGGVNPRTLRERLRELEAEKIVVRQVIRTMPPWVEYELTEKGRALESVMEAMSLWSGRWMTEEESGPAPGAEPKTGS